MPLSLPAPRPASEADQSLYAAGVAAGRAEALVGATAAMDQARADLDRAALVLGQALFDLNQARSEAVEVAASDAVGLAMDLVAAILGQAPVGLSTERVVAALALVPDSDVLSVLRVHPDDLDVVSDSVADVKVVADETVERGGCVVEAGPTRIDAQRGPALARLHKAIAR
ncbi:MAG: FliH/SctL family protein [Acidimicrobiales bacterium]